MLKTAKLYQYQIEMQPGVILRQEWLKQRTGLLICLQQGDKQGWGEIAPLPEFSSENLAEASSATIDWINSWQEDTNSIDMTPPSVAFGLSCALAELNQQLPDSGNFRQVLNCNGDPDELFQQINALSGEKIASIEVGLYESVRDGMIVNMLLEAIPDLKLRLEGRRSWSLSKAQGFAKYVNPKYRSRIVYLSEPCKQRLDSEQFCAQNKIALAWDTSYQDQTLNFDAQGLSTLIIKPTQVGSLEYCQQLIEQARQHNVQSVISSSFESSFGLTQLARIAQQLTPGIIANLNTLRLMKAQLIRSWPDSTLPILALDKLELVYVSEKNNPVK